MYGDTTSMQALVDNIKTFWQAFSAMLPSGLTITVPSSGDVLDEQTGNITGSWSVGTAAAVVTGTGSGGYAGNAGLVVHWLTSTIANTRRLRGRTFVVPLVSLSYDSTGSLTPASITTATNAAAALVTSSGTLLQVWHRPVYSKPKTTPPTLITPGSRGVVTGSRVPDLAVSLRSRRI
jgi:hypothetical protein